MSFICHLRVTNEEFFICHLRVTKHHVLGFQQQRPTVSILGVGDGKGDSGRRALSGEGLFLFSLLGFQMALFFVSLGGHQL